MNDNEAAGRRALLAQHFLLAQLDEAALDTLLAVASERRFTNGQVIFQKGDPGTSMMAVLSGRVRISAYSEDGREIILNMVDPGQLFGEIALLDGKERSADATAMGKTELLILDRRDFLPFLERNPKIAVQLIEVLCDRVRRTSEMVESIAFLDFRGKAGELLLQMAEKLRQADRRRPPDRPPHLPGRPRQPHRLHPRERQPPAQRLDPRRRHRRRPGQNHAHR